MGRKSFMKKIFAIMLVFGLLIGITACGSNSGRSENGQDTIGQSEENYSGEERAADSASEPAAVEPESGMETESPEDMAGGAETADTDGSRSP